MYINVAKSKTLIVLLLLIIILVEIASYVLVYVASTAVENVVKLGNALTLLV